MSRNRKTKIKHNPERKETTNKNTSKDARSKGIIPVPESIAIVFEIAKESMQQEKDRASLIMTKSQNLLKYISSTLGVVNTVLVFMVNQKMIDVNQWVLGMIIINIPLMISLINAVSAQIMLRGNFFPSGIVALTDMESKNGDIDEVFRYQVYQLTCMRNYTDSLNDANSKRAKQIKIGHILYITSVIIILWCFAWYFCFKDEFMTLLKMICDKIR